ncbi:unnamed protein product [Citrullus colocynthis]|uniref:Uncharacterized protein n=1 Tax=Citrullus colocynthis TaxID=252529 RepID=A0ABP0Y6F7_9ROSI
MFLTYTLTTHPIRSIRTVRSQELLNAYKRFGSNCSIIYRMIEIALNQEPLVQSVQFVVYYSIAGGMRVLGRFQNKVTDGLTRKVVDTRVGRVWTRCTLPWLLL